MNGHEQHAIPDKRTRKSSSRVEGSATSKKEGIEPCHKDEAACLGGSFGARDRRLEVLGAGATDDGGNSLAARVGPGNVITHVSGHKYSQDP